MSKWLERWRRVDDTALIPLVPGLELTPEWQEAISNPYYASWRDIPVDHERVRGAVAYRVIRRLRDGGVRTMLAAGDPFWVQIAINVIATEMLWHQSSRTQLSAMRSLSRCVRSGVLKDGLQRQAMATIELALVRSVERGVGEEFRALTRVARAVASPNLIYVLRKRATDGGRRSVRINALRMLDVIEGRPYRRYHEVSWGTAPG